MREVAHPVERPEVRERADDGEELAHAHVVLAEVVAERVREHVQVAHDARERGRARDVRHERVRALGGLARACAEVACVVIAVTVAVVIALDVVGAHVLPQAEAEDDGAEDEAAGGGAQHA
jgi:hypothetical protein